MKKTGEIHGKKSSSVQIIQDKEGESAISTAEARTLGMNITLLTNGQLGLGAAPHFELGCRCPCALGGSLHGDLLTLRQRRHFAGAFSDTTASRMMSPEIGAKLRRSSHRFTPVYGCWKTAPGVSKSRTVRNLSVGFLAQRGLSQVQRAEKLLHSQMTLRRTESRRATVRRKVSFEFSSVFTMPSNRGCAGRQGRILYHRGRFQKKGLVPYGT
jgi:hypothetical protein